VVEILLHAASSARIQAAASQGMPFGKKTAAAPAGARSDNSFTWDGLASRPDNPAENHFVNSRGLLAACDIRSDSPQSSVATLKGYTPEAHRRLQAGSEPASVYVCSSALKDFVQTMLLRIRVPFVLVSGDCDDDVPFDVFETEEGHCTRLERWLARDTRPEPEEAAAFDALIVTEKQMRQRPGADMHTHEDLDAILNHPNLRHWFCQNWSGVAHPKITCLPIGLDFHTMSTSKTNWVSCREQEQELMAIRQAAKPFWERKCKVYGNFHFATDANFNVLPWRKPLVGHVYDRRDAVRLLDPAVMEYEVERISRGVTWTRQSELAFVASPHGFGLDCHRTWEAMVLGCIPIVKRSKVGVMFEDLPVLAVNSWDEVTPGLLEKTVEDMRSKTFNYDKLSLAYWTNLIEQAKLAGSQ